MSRHKEKPNYDRCCSCTPILESKVKELEYIIKGLVKTSIKYRKPHPMDRPNRLGKVKDLLEERSNR